MRNAYSNDYDEVDVRKICSKRTSSYEIHENSRADITPSRRVDVNAINNKFFVSSCDNRIEDNLFNEQIRTLEKEVNENYRSKSKLSNYDSGATPIIDKKKNPFNTELQLTD